jgi:hypothetical protein
MKKTWLYKELHKIQKESPVVEYEICKKSLMFTSIVNIVTAIFVGIFLLLTPILSITTFFLGIFKDSYDLYYYLNAEKIAKKEAIKKALELKTNIKNWIDYYQTGLNKVSPYMLQQIIYEEKPKVGQLPGVNVGYQGGIQQGMWLPDPLPFSRFPSNRYKRHYNKIEKKELLTKEFINSKHSKFEDFIIEFFKTYNNECNTIDIYHQQICDVNRRRSLHDIYLITKYYYSEVTFLDIIKTILSLLKIGVICSSYCSTVNKYVFYTPNVSPHNSFNHTLEFADELTFNDLKKYIEDEQ